jgi:hypothetical protein
MDWGTVATSVLSSAVVAKLMDYMTEGKRQKQARLDDLKRDEGELAWRVAALKACTESAGAVEIMRDILAFLRKHPQYMNHPSNRKFYEKHCRFPDQAAYKPTELSETALDELKRDAESLQIH